VDVRPDVHEASPALDEAMLPALATVVARRQETRDTFTLTLAPESGPVPFLPGQFSMLSVFGIGEIPISHAGDPRDTTQHVHTIRAVGAVSRALVDVGVGEQVGWRGPFGTAWPIAGAHGKDIVIVAGGIGLAPVWPIVHAALAQRDTLGRVTLVIGSRTPADRIYTRELEALRREGRIAVLEIVDAADLSWSGSVGVVTKLLPHVEMTPRHTRAFVCGPEIMMRFVAQAFIERGVSAGEVFVSLERNMKCGVGICGHCQIGPLLLCRDGPVVPWTRARPLVRISGL
jgi:anaerobic sulfite reductase subunit B